MSLSLDDIQFLKSEAGRESLAAYANADLSPQNSLSLLLAMRQNHHPRQAAALLTTLRLRRKAAAKFPHLAQDMLFTEAGLQQASDPRVRAYRADKAQSSEMRDVCCGIGGDAIAFAGAGKVVFGSDIDPAHVAIARHNAAVAGVDIEFAVGDARDRIPSGAAGIFFDPARRDETGKRISHVERYLPPLSTIRDWRADEIIVKLSPAVSLSQLDEYPGQVEFVSVAGDLKEALLWASRRAACPLATRIDVDGIHHLQDAGDYPVALSEPRAWLLEPDPALMRSGALRRLALELGASLLDESIAWLTLDSRIETRWGRYFRVLDWMPFSLKRLRQYLAARDIGRVTVKKRGFPMLPEELIARLRLKGGGDSRILVATRWRGRHIIVICAD